jgi:hypothetical protein
MKKKKRGMDDFDKMYCNMKLFTPHEWGEFPSYKKLIIEMKKLYDLKTVQSLCKNLETHVLLNTQDAVATESCKWSIVILQL